MNSTEILNNVYNLIEKLEEYQSCYTNALNFETSKNKEMNLFYEEKGLVIPDFGISNLINKHMEDILILITKAKNLKEKVENPIVKISLFGRVSVGKSRLLNAILYQDLFRSGAAHTTSCFVRISKSEDNFHKLSLVEGENIEISMEDLKKRLRQISTNTNISSDTQLDSNKCVDVYLNINNNKILRENIQIVDIPGINRRDLLTRIIEEQSLDADIFIFVMTNTLNDTERNFFQYQSRLSSNPDIFVLVNKWDETDKNDEEETEESKAVITAELIELLTKEGNLSTENAITRIYFISGHEIYEQRVKNIKIDENISHTKEIRFQQFEKFENDLANYIVNPVENKNNRIRKNLQQIQNILEVDKNKFKNEMNIKRSSQYQIIRHIKKGIKDLNENNEKIIKITEEFSKLSDNINEKLTSFSDKLNENNITETSDEIEKYLYEMQTKFSDLIESVNEEIDEIIKIYKQTIEDCKMKINVKQDELNLTDMNCNLQSCSTINPISYPITIPGLILNIPVAIILNSIGSLGSIFHKKGLIFFEAAKIARQILVPISKERKDLENSLKNNKDSINILKEKLKVQIEVGKKNLENNLCTEKENMFQILNYKSEYITNYWISIEEYFPQLN